MDSDISDIFEVYNGMTMKNGVMTLDWASVADSIITAIFVAVVVGLAGIVTTPGFDVFNADWVSIGHNMINFAFVSGIGSLAKTFMSDNNGKVLGIGSQQAQ